ncbi:MAG: GntR family transcriptional regulator [Lachnospiraceae bacterium]
MDHYRSSELAQYFDVSRTPVREAIQMLERQKLVKVIPSRGSM